MISTNPISVLRNADSIRVSAALASLIGAPQAEKLMAQFHWNANFGLWTNRQYDQIPRDQQILKPMFQANQRIVPLALGGLKDLSFYEIAGGFPEKGWARKKTDPKAVALPYLEKYLLIPTRSGKLVMVVDDHNHTAFGTVLAHRCGITKPGAFIINVDEHEDSAPDPTPYAFNNRTPLEGIAFHTWTRMMVNSHFSFLGNRGSGSLLSEGWGEFHLAFVNAANNGKGLFEDTNNGNCEGCRSILIDGATVSLERLQEVVDEVKNAGASIVFNLDLDYFSDFYSLNGRDKVLGFSFDETMSRLVAIARQCDFIAVATSPNWFAIESRSGIPANFGDGFVNAPTQQELRYLLSRFIGGLNR